MELERDRELLNMNQINEILTKIRKSNRFSEERLEIIKSDLEYGIPEEDVKLHYRFSNDTERMRVLSKCLRTGVPKEVIEIILGSDFTPSQSQVVYSVYMEKNVDEAAITERMAKLESMLVMQTELIQKLLGRAEAPITAPAAAPTEKTPEPPKQETKLQEEPVQTVTQNPVPKTEPEKVFVLPTDCVSPFGMIQRTEKPKKNIPALFAAMKLKKSKKELVQLVVEGKIGVDQLEVIKGAYLSGISEQVIMKIIHSGADAIRMSNAVEIAILQMQLGSC